MQFFCVYAIISWKVFLSRKVFLRCFPVKFAKFWKILLCGCFFPQTMYGLTSNNESFAWSNERRWILIIYYTKISFKMAIPRDGSRTAVTYNGFQPLTIITKSSTLDIAAVLDPGADDPGRICEFSKFQCEKMSATMVGRRRKFLILDELKQS